MKEAVSPDLRFGRAAACEVALPFLPASYYIVAIRMMDAWRPHYRDRRTIQLHTSMSGAEAELAIAARSLGADRVGIARLTPQGLAVEPTATPENNRSHTNTEQGAQP